MSDLSESDSSESSPPQAESEFIDAARDRLGYRRSLSELPEADEPVDPASETELPPSKSGTRGFGG